MPSALTVAVCHLQNESLILHQMLDHCASLELKRPVPQVIYGQNSYPMKKGTLV
jgi:hypothetical protein